VEVGTELDAEDGRGLTGGKPSQIPRRPWCLKSYPLIMEIGTVRYSCESATHISVVSQGNYAGVQTYSISTSINQPASASYPRAGHTLEQ